MQRMSEAIGYERRSLVVPGWRVRHLVRTAWTRSKRAGPTLGTKRAGRSSSLGGALVVDRAAGVKACSRGILAGRWHSALGYLSPAEFSSEP